MLKNHPGIRLALYLLGVAAAVAAPIIAVAVPEYGTAVATVAGVLNAAALGTAATNLTGVPPDDEL